MIDKLLSWIFPHCCKRCGAEGAVVCERCKKYIVENTTLRLLSGDIWAVGKRKGLLKKLVDDYKFRCERGAAEVLAEILDEVLPVDDDFVVTFIPTAPARIRTRGFDHMALVAKKFAKKRGLKYGKFLYRRNNRSQKFLKEKERRKAAKEAFGMSGKEVPKKVLLLDDIYTTGATVKAARKLLLESGAKKVMVAVICKQ